MGVRQTLEFIARHPLTSDRPLPAVARYVAWQVRSRLQDEVAVPWITGAELVVRRGMHGATGNIYCGLHEFADMAFVMHVLRPGDLFVDAGANVGSYTVLAARVCGAHACSVEPDPAAMRALRKNIAVNGVDDLVDAHEAVVSDAARKLRFTVGRDSTNRVAHAGDEATRDVTAVTIDQLLEGRTPTLIKLDLEGHESRALSGATQTLASSNVLAVQTETSDEAVTEALRSAGFRRWSYDAFDRRLRPGADGRRSANALFLRDGDLCRSRVENAPLRRIFHHAV